MDLSIVYMLVRKALVLVQDQEALLHRSFSNSNKHGSSQSPPPAAQSCRNRETLHGCIPDTPVQPATWALTASSELGYVVGYI